MLTVNNIKKLLKKFESSKHNLKIVCKSCIYPRAKSGGTRSAILGVNEFPLTPLKRYKRQDIDDCRPTVKQVKNDRALPTDNRHTVLQSKQLMNREECMY